MAASTPHYSQALYCPSPHTLQRNYSCSVYLALGLLAKCHFPEKAPAVIGARQVIAYLDVHYRAVSS